jgi:FtsP/CotA-like multicopper oxidase with cupredoxin domain
MRSKDKGKFKMTRRQVLKAGMIAGAGMMVPWNSVILRNAFGATQANAVPLPGSALPQFVDELPVLGTGMVPEFGNDITIRMKEFRANMMPSTFMPATGTYTGTYVWGYQVDGNVPAALPSGALPTYINPVVVATRHVPTKITWVNELPTGANSLTYWEDWTDLTLHWAHPNGEILNEHYRGSIPAVPHLHGGEVPPQLDGGPDAWFTNEGVSSQHGHAYWAGAGGSGNNTAVYNYPNTQEAAPIWFHDHALGITRLNVYAGIAGAYLLLDDANPWPIDPTRIVPMVIQDRMFDTDGQLYFPAGPPFSPNPGVHPFWVPEFEGDVICVNGKVWPKLTVKPARYAFWFLNGSNARTYNMFLTDPVSKNFGPPIWVIGTDGGLLDTPVQLDPTLAANNSLTLMPGERYLAIIDFAGYEAGVVGPNGAAYSGNWLLKNNAKTPFPAGVAVNGRTTGRVMQFVVNQASGLPDEAYNPALPTTDPDYIPLREQPMVRLVDPVAGTPGAGVFVNKTRQLTLNEVMGPAGPLAALVNNTKWDGLRPDGETPVNGGVAGPDGVTYYTELPMEGETELWEVVTLTADAHPIHLHLVQFQLMNRQKFNVNKYSAVYNAAFPGGVYIPEYGPPLAYDTGNPNALGGNPDVGELRRNKPKYLQGPLMPPLPEEAGWKDTVIMYPGEVTRIMVRWAPTDLPADTAAADAYFPFDPNGGHGYVWHCHIIDHEDNEMMRPDSVIVNWLGSNAPIPDNRELVKGEDY